MTKSLPTNPSLEHLKNEAKAILKSQKDQDASVCLLLRNLQYLEKKSDAEILNSKLKLTDCQFALAIEYGFSSWNAMKGFIKKQSQTDTEKLSSQLILEAISKKASDIHLDWNDKTPHIKLRTGGELQNSETQISESKDIIIAEFKTMAGLDVNIKDQPQRGMARFKIHDKPVIMRVSVIPCISGESLVVRIFDDLSKITLDRMGFNVEQSKTIHKWLDSPNGIIVFSGPVGSGKTTTMLTALTELDPGKRKILTAEDPVYRIIDGISQLQIQPSKGITYEKAIQTLMYQDPDVIMVGECADHKVLQQICIAALTGHLILTQMHANSTAHVLRRLLDMRGEPYTLNSSITGIISQRLVRKICQDCKEEYQPEEWVKSSLAIDNNTLFRGKGCEKCNNSGYRGRIAIYEMLELNDELRSVLARKPDYDELKQSVLKTGAKTLKEDGLNKVSQGLTTIDEVLRVCASD